MATVQIRQLIEFVLNNPKNYPGIHNASQPRTTQGLPQLDPSRQMMLIWDGMCTYVQEVLEQGKSVHIKGLGAFTYEPIVAGGGNQKNSRGHSLRLRPCFVASDALKETLHRYPGKEEVSIGPGSIYQQGVKMTYLNTVPIAAGTYYKEPVVAASLAAFFRGVLDLSTRGYSVELDFKFAKVRIVERNLHVFFSRDFTMRVQGTAAAWPSRRDTSTIAETWQKKNLSESMMNFHERPNSRDCTRAKTRTLQLGILSLDLNSCTPAA